MKVAAWRSVVNLRGRQELLRIGQGNVGAEADHAEARGDALTATEGRAISELALERRCKQNDDEIRGGVENDRDRAENHELQKNVAAVRVDELRDEGQEEQSGLRIEGFGEDALTECPLGWRRDCHGEFRMASTDHADAEPDEIRRSGVLD